MNRPVNTLVLLVGIAIVVAVLVAGLFLRRPEILLAVMFVGYYPYFWLLSYSGLSSTSLFTAVFLLFCFACMLTTIVLRPRFKPRSTENLIVIVLAYAAIVTWLIKLLARGAFVHIEPLFWMFPLMLGPYFAAQVFTREQVFCFSRWVVVLSTVFLLIMIFEAVTGRGYMVTSLRLIPFRGYFNPITSGYILGYGLILGLSYVMQERSIVTVGGWIAWAGVVVWLITLTGTRQTFIYLPLVIMALLAGSNDGLRKFFRLKGATVLAWMGVISAVATCVGLHGGIRIPVERLASPIRRTLAIFESPESVSESRLGLWQAIWSRIVEGGFIGGGFGTSFEVGGAGGAHNLLLESFSDYGLLGFVGMSLFVILVSRRAMNLLRAYTWWERGLAALWFFVFLNTMVSGRLTGVVNFWTLAGLLVGMKPARPVTTQDTTQERWVTGNDIGIASTYHSG